MNILQIVGAAAIYVGVVYFMSIILAMFVVYINRKKDGMLALVYVNITVGTWLIVSTITGLILLGVLIGGYL